MLLKLSTGEIYTGPILKSVYSTDAFDSREQKPLDYRVRKHTTELMEFLMCTCCRLRYENQTSDACEEAWAGRKEREARRWEESERGGQQEDAAGIIPILLVKLQHHVVRGNAQWASALVVLLLALRLVHVRGGHGAVVGVVVGVDRAAVAAGQVEFDI